MLFIDACSFLSHKKITLATDGQMPPLRKPCVQNELSAVFSPMFGAKTTLTDYVDILLPKVACDICCGTYPA